MATGQARLFRYTTGIVLIIASICTVFQSAYAELLPTYVYITEVQVADTEFIELYNPYDTPLSLQGWQLKYRGSGASETSLKTFGANDIIPAQAFMVGSHGFSVPSGISSFTFNASLANGAGYVVLYDATGNVVDIVGWGSGALNKQGSPAAAPAEDQSIQRCFQDGLLALAHPADNSQEFQVYSETTAGSGVNCPIPANTQGPIETNPSAPVDICLNIDGVQETVPQGYHQTTDVVCEADLLPATCLVEISEISAQPNYNGQEYVELYNHTTTEASVALCKLRINSTTNKALPNVALAPGAYLVIPFTSGVIRNSAGQVTLVTSDSELVYNYPATTEGQTVNFEHNSHEGRVSAWPTPGVANLQDQSDGEDQTSVTITTALAACPSGKYRNPETNRCKNIEAATTILTECKEGQERNPETNRCRKAETTSSALKACDAGQERNPETNRCRKVGSSITSLTPCQPGYERNPQTNRCKKANVTASSLTNTSKDLGANPLTRFGFRILLLVTFAVAGYGIYEYRVDIANLWYRWRHNQKISRTPD